MIRVKICFNLPSDFRGDDF